jgi:hypothetical protein
MRVKWSAEPVMRRSAPESSFAGKACRSSGMGRCAASGSVARPPKYIELAGADGVFLGKTQAGIGDLAVGVFRVLWSWSQDKGVANWSHGRGGWRSGRYTHEHHRFIVVTAVGPRTVARRPLSTSCRTDLPAHVRPSRASMSAYSPHVTSYTRTGSSNPFSATVPRSAKRNPFPDTSCRTTSETRISFPLA